MKITREQVVNWNKKCSNGFKLDVQQCVVWGEKEAVKIIDMGDGKRLKAAIRWHEVRPSTWGKLEGLRPKLDLSIWEPCENSDLWRSYGFGHTVEITDQLYKRRNWNDLAKFTAEWDDERIMAEATAHISKMKNARIA